MRFKKTGNTVKDPLVRLSHKKARVIGRNFAHALRQRKTAAAGVDQWRLKYPAMRQLMQKEPWVEVGWCVYLIVGREGEKEEGGAALSCNSIILSLSHFNPHTSPCSKAMMVAVGQEMMSTVPWGLRWRVFLGAKLSLLDIITDIYMIYQYLTSDEKGQAIFGYINAIMVAASLFFQLLIVYGQNKKKGMKKMASETLTAILFLKPAVDAFRVASGATAEEGSAFDPLAELITTKACEMVRHECRGIVGGVGRYSLIPLTHSLTPLPPLLHMKVRREHTFRNTPILCIPQIGEEEQRRPVVYHNLCMYYGSCQRYDFVRLRYRSFQTSKQP